MDDQQIFAVFIIAVVFVGIVVALVLANQAASKRKAEEKAGEIADLAAMLDKTEDGIHIAPRGESQDIEVAGETGTYTVNVIQQTCTCPDFKEVRAAFPEGHLRRICKHLAAEMAKILDPSNLTGLMFARIHFGLSPQDHFCLQSLDDGRQFFAFRHADREWCDVIAPRPRGTNYDFYGFNIAQGRWSYGISPARAKEIKAKVRRWAGALQVYKMATRV